VYLKKEDVYLKILLKQKKFFYIFFTLTNCAGKSTYFLGSECVKPPLQLLFQIDLLSARNLTKCTDVDKTS